MAPPAESVGGCAEALSGGSFRLLMPVPRYFPVLPKPLQVRAGLSRLGTDFGNGRVDSQIFQSDERTPEALVQKRAVVEDYPERFGLDTAEHLQPSLHGVLDWMRATLREEQGIELESSGVLRSDAQALALQVAEDFVVLTRDGDHERCSLVHVCFPSGWRPEAIFGQDFATIHAPVPGFSTLGRTSSALVRAMFERGPYVRFVWTVCADDRLDHHPARPRVDWSAPQARGFLRVERQLMLPFAPQDASLFVIRTHLYPFDELSPTERRVLARALMEMPPEMLRYKGLVDGLPHALRMIG